MNNRSFLIKKCLIMLFFCLAFSYAEAISKGEVGDEVMAHYQKTGDKEKLAAAKFLVENMRYHHAYESPLLDTYYGKVHEVSTQYKYPASISHYQAIYKDLGNIGEGKQEVCDIDKLTVQQLIANIDMAFADWRERRWACHLSFEQFCEYLLPYRVGEERFEDCRQGLRLLFLPYAEEQTACDERKNSAYWAATGICNGIKAFNFKVDDKALPHSEVELPVSVLMDMKMGECSNYAKLTTYIMRSCGVPISYDYTPQWPNKAMRHSWNALLNNTGKTVPFLGSETYPGQNERLGDKMAKVFRRTFAYQPQSAYALNEKWGETLPPTLATPFFADVSDEYFNGANVSLTLAESSLERHLAYLAVFDNREWIPVDYAVIDSVHGVQFSSIGREILYLPVLWGRNGSVPCGNPFFLKPDGSTRQFVPNTNKKISLRLERKYPLFGRMLDYARSMKGGWFEASDSANFKDAVKVATISEIPFSWYNVVKVNTSGRKYRYWRYCAPNGKKGNIAELELFCDGKELPVLSVMGDDMNYEGAKVKKIIDKNRLSYYESRHSRGAWVGVDLGEPAIVDELRFIPRNDDNHVVKGHVYKLDYFNNGRQVTVGSKVATEDFIVFDGVPADALYILHDLSAGTEERPFSVKNGEITWY